MPPVIDPREAAAAARFMLASPPDILRVIHMLGCPPDILRLIHMLGCPPDILRV